MADLDVDVVGDFVVLGFDVAGFLFGADFGLLFGCLIFAGRGGTAGFCLVGWVG